MRHDYFDEARQFGQGQVGWFIVRISDPDRAAEIAVEIDALFENSMDETKSSTEKEFALSFARQLGDIGLIVTGILGAVFFTIILLTGNTMAQATRERVPELALLKTVGFTNLQVLGLVLSESVLLMLLGGAIGLGLSIFMVLSLDDLQGFIPGLTVSPANIAAGFGVSLGLGLLVGLLPASRAMRLTIVDAMREGV